MGVKVMNGYGIEQIGNIAEVREQQGITVVTLRGRMDIFNAPLLMKQLNRLLEAGDAHFVVDLSDVRVLDTDGDYPLLHLLRCAQEAGGSVGLVCPVGNPVRVFYEMMHLDTLFLVSETLEEALSAFSSSHC